MVSGLHGFLVGVGTERFHLAAHVDHRFVKRIPQGVARVAANNDPADLRHEGGVVPDAPPSDDSNSLHRDPAAQRGIAFDDEQSTVRGRPRGDRSESLDPNAARAHAFRHARPGIAVYRDVGLLVHACGVVAGVALDIDAHRSVDPDRDGMGAVGIEHAHVPRAVQAPVLILVQIAQLVLAQIESSFGYARHTYISWGLGSKSRAFFTPGRCASERYSEEMATYSSVSATIAGLQEKASRTMASSFCVPIRKV